MRTSPDESDAIAVITRRVNCEYGGDDVSVSVIESVGCAAYGKKRIQERTPSEDGAARVRRTQLTAEVSLYPGVGGAIRAIALSMILIISSSAKRFRT